MDWQVIAAVLASIVATLLGIIWARVSGDLARVADRLAELGQVVHGHGIRLDLVEGGRHDAR